MAQSKGARSKGDVQGGGTGTVTVVLPSAAAKDLLNALAQALGGVGGKATLKAKATARPKAASQARSKAAPKAASQAARKAV
jgi:hypothetical protein